MIKYKRFQLENGLRVLLNHDPNTPLVNVNLLYQVGAKHENPNRTGFAHLFEHLMFSGSSNVPDYDTIVQRVGGENNAFTNNDFTNYYLSLPGENIETALWIESDRMRYLSINPHSLDVQKGVVIEEFKQRYLNQPYGDVWLLLRPLAYKVHPYRWPTIGMSIEHIEKAILQDVHDFYLQHYRPDNAILSISGNYNENLISSQIETWFAEIPAGRNAPSLYPTEPKQLELRTETVRRKVDFDAVYMAFHITDRRSNEYYVFDLISDILSTGKSSRFYQELIQKQNLFSEVNAWISGDQDAGLFIISGILMKGIKPEKAVHAIWRELEKLKKYPPSIEELNKVKIKLESNTRFSETSALYRAMNLAYFEMLGNPNLINQDLEAYLPISGEQISKITSEYLTESNSSILYYLVD